MDTTVLKQIGFTEGEVRVYLALLRLGAVSAGPIAKEARVARSKLYEILGRLAQKGVVSHSVKNGVRYFSAAQPSRLLDFLKKKELEAKEQYAQVEKILPQLEGEYELQSVKQEAEVFEGLEGLKNVREKYVKSIGKGGEVYFFGVPSSAYYKMEAYYADWNQRRIRKGVKSYTIFTQEAKAHAYVAEKAKHNLTFMRFLPSAALTHAWVEIYGDTVVIAINHKKPMSIVINNKYVAQSYKSYFDMLWKISSSG